MINDFDLIVLRIVCACDRLGVIKSHAISQKGCHFDNVVRLNLYLDPKWLNKNYFDQVTKFFPYFINEPFFKRWRLRRFFGRRGCSYRLGGRCCCCSSRRRYWRLGRNWLWLRWWFCSSSSTIIIRTRLLWLAGGCRLVCL